MWKGVFKRTPPRRKNVLFRALPKLPFFGYSQRKKFMSKIFGCGPFYKKCRFSPISVSPCCGINFEASDLPHLKRYFHKFSGLPQKLTCCELFGLQLLPNSEECIFFTPERLFLGVVFGQKEFSRPNGKLLPTAYHTYSESYASKAKNGLSWSNFSASWILLANSPLDSTTSETV